MKSFSKNKYGGAKYFNKKELGEIKDEVKIHRDGSLKFAYGGLIIVFWIVALFSFLLGYNIHSRFIFGSALLLLLPQLDPRPLLVINDIGFTKKGKVLAKWKELEKIIFELKRSQNGSWMCLEIWTKNKSKPITYNLKRTTVIPKELYSILVKYTKSSGLGFDVIGLEKWK